MKVRIDPRVVGAFEEAIRLGAREQGFLKMADVTVQMFALELAAELRDEERASLGCPVQVFTGSKTQPGALLLLEHRALVAWGVGTFKPTATVLEFPIGETLHVVRMRRKPGRLAQASDGLELADGGREVDFLFYSQLQEERLTSMIEAALNGSMTFGWSEADGDS